LRHQSLLTYANYRWLKAAAFLVVLSIAGYAWYRPAGGPNGGTWVGYTLGTIGALLIVWLAWFGVRKRNYVPASLLLGWLSAHVYLGSTLIVVVTLHAAFQVGWNVHTLAYVLMLLVILSGFYGIYTYVRNPRAMTENLGEDTMDSLLLKIADLDKQARTLALGLPDVANQLVLADRRLLAAAALRARSGLPDDRGRQWIAVTRPRPARRAGTREPAALHAPPAQAGIARPRATGCGTQGAPRDLAVCARAAVDRADRRADRAHRERVLLLVMRAR